MAVNITDRNAASALMKPEQVTEIFKMVGEKSKVLSKMRRLPNMSSKTTRMPILDMLPVTYFVNGDTGRKQTTKAEWKDKFITAEELAVIVPLPESVIADADYNITAEMIPLIVDAFAKKIDEAILNGDDAPASWPMGLLPLAKNQGHTVTLASDTDAQDFYQKVLGVGGVISQVEKDGFPVNGVLGSLTAKAKVRGLVDTTGRPLSVGGADIDGMPVGYVDNGSWTDEKSLLLVGDFTKCVYSMRQEITMKKFTEGVVQDGDGSIAYNLMQNDMIAIRFVMRLGWQVANPVTQLNGNAETRYPISILEATSPEALKDVTFTVNAAEGTTPVKDVEVTVGEITRKTNASGKATINVPNGYTGKWFATKGDIARHGDLKNVTNTKTVTVNNFKTEA